MFSVNLNILFQKKRLMNRADDFDDNDFGGVIAGSTAFVEQQNECQEGNCDGMDYEDDSHERAKLLKPPRENWHGLGEPENAHKVPKTQKKQRIYRSMNSILNPQVRINYSKFDHYIVMKSK